MTTLHACMGGGGARLLSAQVAWRAPPGAPRTGLSPILPAAGEPDQPIRCQHAPFYPQPLRNSRAPSQHVVSNGLHATS